MLSDCFPILSVFYFKKNREKIFWKESEMFPTHVSQQKEQNYITHQ
jgi:hypothetical protein